MRITISSKGDWEKTEAWLRRLQHGRVFATLDRFGPIGVAALASATPVDQSTTANSWTYDIKKSATGYSIQWRNTHVNGGVPIAIILQYGHGTGTGGYVSGRDYINPAIQPIFDQMIAEVVKVVKQ